MLMGPRRMGEGCLINHVFALPEIQKEYYTFYVNIHHTNSQRELVQQLGKMVFNTLAPKGNKFGRLFLDTVSSLSCRLGYDAQYRHRQYLQSAIYAAANISLL